MTGERGNRVWAAPAVVVILMVLPAAIALPAQTLTTLHSFDGTDGAYAVAPLVQATDGNLYGTTYAGGARNDGTIFKITPNGTLTTLHSFNGDPDGEWPSGRMVQATDGDLYGTTLYGGASGSGGTVFKITPAGTLTTLYNFCSQSGCTDGYDPDAGLVQGSDGSFYGATGGGGTGGACNGGCVTIFKITSGGALTTLYSFCSQIGCADGNTPIGLIWATDGNLYGTTSAGGTNNEGTVFKITPSGTLTTLHSFDNTDGSGPSGLVQAANGNFYGTTSYGGANSCLTVVGTYLGCGTAFKITPNGTLTTLYNFCSQSGCTDGYNPAALLVRATDGSVYGTSVYGGRSSCDINGFLLGCGTIFKITQSGTLTTVVSFESVDGESPWGGLVQDTNGNFYGTTSYGGNNGYGNGTVFSLSLGLGPFLETQPPFGKVGLAVKILGTNLKGATSVSFNGTPAVFKVISPSEIGATVPDGAITGTVQVVTPSGTLSSNVPFRVR
ncbi:MAG TPA: choice-of-anchor tandem repeat GloVer-containing protein [Terriglobia bacterium]